MNFLCCSVFLCSKNFYGKLFDQEAAADPFIDFCCKIKLSSFSRTGRLMDSSRVMIRYIEHPACKILTASSRPISLIRDMSSPKGTKRAKLKPQIKSNFIFFFFFAIFISLEITNCRRCVLFPFVQNASGLTTIFLCGIMTTSVKFGDFIGHF